MLFGLGIGVLVYAAFVFDLFGFLARDELWLRLLMLAGSALYIIYYYVVTDLPLWDAIITNGLLALANLAMIFVVITERTTFAMSAEDSELYAMFPMLTPGQFRALVRAAERVEGGAGQTLSTEGQALDRLYFVSHGTVEVAKGGTSVPISAPAFIGEVAFITRAPATATVTATATTRALVWDHARLDAMFHRKPALQVALAAHLNTDLARKVATSQPTLAAPEPS